MVERQPRFGWYELLTTDLAAAQSFYGAVLGWQTRSAATPRFDYRLFTMGERAVCGLMELPPEGLKSAGVGTKEVDLAKRLVNDMTEHWDAGKYHNTYHDDLMKRIEQKIKEGRTEEITEPERGEASPRSAQVIDLAALLKQSLAKGAGGSRAPARAAASKRARPTTAKAPARRKRA